jgi:hypothetical protein
VPQGSRIYLRINIRGLTKMSETKKKRGRPALFGKAMTVAERQHRHRAARSKRLREAMTDPFPNIPTGAEMLARLGYDVPVMSEATLAALRAQPGGNDAFEADEDGNPAIGLDVEPVYPGDSESL